MIPLWLKRCLPFRRSNVAFRLEYFASREFLFDQGETHFALCYTGLGTRCLPRRNLCAAATLPLNGGAQEIASMLQLDKVAD
jgi:hypothetical protein